MTGQSKSRRVRVWQSMSAAIIVVLQLGQPAHAGEIAPGVSVVPSQLRAPINELPYFGFQPKTPQQGAADIALVDSVNRAGVTKQAGAERATQIAWQMIQAGKFDEAARRLNQAWLLQPDRSDIAHMFAIVVQERFRDPAYASRLFTVAASLKNPMPTLPADHARVLLLNKQFAAAIPLLEQAVRQTPDWAVPKSNLAMALFQAGQREKSCQALARISGKDIESVRADMQALKNAAKC